MSLEESSIVLARLDRLERQNRRLRWALVMIPVLAFMCGAGFDLADWKGKTVTAEQFTLVDAQGQKRATLAMEQGSPYLTMYNSKGEYQVRLTGDSEGAGPTLFLMTDKPGRVGATLRSFRKDNQFYPQGGGFLGLFNEDEKSLIQAGASLKEKAGGISLYDGKGTYRSGIGGDLPK